MVWSRPSESGNLPSAGKHRWWPRRVRYAVHKALVIAWRLRDVLWRSLIAFAIACGVATIAIMVDRGRTIPLWMYALPFVAALAYALLIGTSRFARAWRSFYLIRNELRMRRLAELRDGGVRTQHFKRLTFLRVRLPFYVLTYGVGLLVVMMLPRARSNLERVVHHGILISIGLSAMFLEIMLVKRNERDRPTEFEKYCPRCGYDLSASPERCPECGLARAAIDRAKKQTRWFKR